MSALCIRSCVYAVLLWEYKVYNLASFTLITVGWKSLKFFVCVEEYYFFFPFVNKLEGFGVEEKPALCLDVSKDHGSNTGPPSARDCWMSLTCLRLKSKVWAHRWYTRGPRLGEGSTRSKLIVQGVPPINFLSVYWFVEYVLLN